MELCLKVAGTEPFIIEVSIITVSGIAMRRERLLGNMVGSGYKSDTLRVARSRVVI